MKKQNFKRYIPTLNVIFWLLIFSILIKFIWEKAGWSFATPHGGFFVLSLLSLLGISAVLALVLMLIEDGAKRLYDSQLKDIIKDSIMRKWFIRFVFFLVLVTAKVIWSYKK